MKKYILVAIMICLSLRMVASVPFIVSGLQTGDKAVVSLSSYQFLSTLEIDADGEYRFDVVPAGTHSLKIETTGYNLPQAKTIIVADDGSVQPAVTLELVVTKMSTDPNEWIHSWKQDESVSGYVTTSYVNTQPEITFLGKRIVPSDVPSFSYLKERYNILLADDEKSWTQEYAYRLLETLKTIPCDKFEWVSKFSLTDELLENDIVVDKQDGGYEVRISSAAFYYANPFLVDLEGVRGRFFSKRLHHALVNFCTDFGRDEWRVNHILTQRFGCSIFVDDYESLTVTNEDAACFQKFVPSELVSIINMFEEMPEGFHKISHLNYLIRRQNGHPHPIYPDAAAVAWPTIENGYIEFMEKAFGANNQAFETLRLILHEKTHFLWAHSFSDEIKQAWIELGGWYKDPNSNSGWSTSKTTEFVSAYAHAKNPDEDMAESVAHYIKNPELLQSRALLKYEFIRDRIMNGTRYISKIPDHLTFEVLNLNPDYDYPGKINRLDVKVEGAPDEDKEVTVEIELTHMEGFLDGASHAYTRITGPAFLDDAGNMQSQFYDLHLDPVDGNDHLLRGTFVLSKYSKSGYWNTDDIVVTDLNNNQRFEGRNDFVFNMYINNALEDLEMPKYHSGSLNYELTDTVFEGHQAQNLRITFKATDDVEIETGMIRLGCDTQEYSFNDFYGTYDSETQLFTMDVHISEYFKTGDYYVEFIDLYDKARNASGISFSDSPNHEKRQSIHVETPNPDYKAPELDLNRIVVYAEPTNKEAPDGETLVTINYYARDDKSGLSGVSYTLKDPQGTMYFEYHYHENFYTEYFDGDPTVWKKYTINTILPRGSVPGIWGLAELTLGDKAWNHKTYNFVETMIFEPDESTDDYVLFAEMVDDKNLKIFIDSKVEDGNTISYRIIHDETGQELNGDIKTNAALNSSEGVSACVDISALSRGKLIVIASVKDSSGKVLAVRTTTLTQGKYKLFYYIDGKEFRSDSIAYGAKIETPQAPEKEGHTFNGWENVPETMPANDVVVVGSYSVNKYLLTFKIGDEVIASDSIEYGAKVETPQAPEKEGHTFSGWKNVPETMPANDVVVVGSYSVNKYLLAFKIGDEVISADSVEYGAKIETPQAPEKEGHTFSGWKDVPETMPAKDVVIVGSYSVNKYLLTFKIGDEVISADSVEYGTKIETPVAPEKEGHTFSGWKDVPETMPAKDVVIVGSYSVNKYLLTFKIGDEVISADSIAYGAKIETPQAPEKEGHTFNGWENVPETMPANDVVVVGSYSVNKYLLAFKIGDEVIASDSVEYGAKVETPQVAEKEGHTFNGWENVPETMPANDIVIVGSYSVNKYLLTFKIGDEVIASDSIEYGAKVETPKAPEKEGHAFCGWKDVPETMPANDVVVVGSYSVNKYLLTFKIGDEVITSDSIEYGAKVETPQVAEKEGHTFNGWENVPETMPANDIVVVGSYTVNIYKVYYYVGDELVHTEEVAYGDNIPSYEYTPTNGDKFMGWEGEQYDTMPAHDVTYIANIESGILYINGDMSEYQIYDLNGRKIENAKSLKSGVYIVNGKKTIVKAN